MKVWFALILVLVFAGSAVASHLSPQVYGTPLADQTKVCRVNLLDVVLQVKVWDTDPADYNAPVIAVYLYRGKVFLLYNSGENMVYIDVDRDGVYDRKLPADGYYSYSPCEALKNVKNGKIKKLNHDRRHKH